MVFFKSSQLLALLVIATVTGYTQARSCWGFDSGSTVLDGWMVSTGLVWQSSIVKAPYTLPIEHWKTPDSGTDYIWMQDQTAPPNTGTIISPDVTINPDDDVSITIYRHIVYDDGTARPVLRYVSDAGTYIHDVLWSYEYDRWDTQAIRCGPSAEPCCLTYPCYGHFELYGSILARDELIAVDAIGLQIEGDLADPCDCLPLVPDETPYCP